MKRDLVFISGGISKNPNFRKDFRRGEKKLRAAGFNVINPVTMIASVELPTHEDYMDISLAWLDKAQAIYMLCGWSTSEGANIEYNHAKVKGIPVFFEDGAERER